MSEPTPLPRSPELLSPGDSGLLVVDVQDKLVRLIDGYRRIIWNIRRLLDAASVLGVPVAATEQYPEKLGGTVAELAQRLGKIHPKLAFSCGGCPPALAELASRGVQKVLVAGIETHVCVQQTVLDLLAEGQRVYVAADATGSRFPVDREFALRRMESCGAALTTTEAVLFEWCGAAGTPQFKAISALVKEQAPAD